MRPLSLEMTAFGSYAETTCVPFEQLRNGLYLVAGDTGAGKTTIFDAVVFALFGKASGRDRSPDMLHCDYVDKSVDTVVKLRFEQDGKEYRVLRSIHFPKKRGEEKQYGDQQISALLLEPDRVPTEGAEKVTRRVEALLGLNAEQFRKIVMLAQGEFREFLKADSDKKNEILGKLFDNREYLAYQSLLSGARDELNRRRSERREELRRLMLAGFRLPEGMTEEERIYFLPGNPELAEHLRALVGAEEERLSELAREKEALRQRISELDSRRGAAEALNARFAEAERLTRELESLEARTGEMDELSRSLERSETAFYRVRPAMEELARAEKSLQESLQELQQRRREAAEASAALEKAALTAADDEEKTRRLRELELALRRLEDQLQALAEQEKRRGELAELRREAARSAAALESLERDCAEKEQELQRQKERLDRLEGAEALALQRQGEVDRAREQETALAALDRERRELRREKENLDRESASLRRLAGAALAAEEEYHSLYRRFLAGQAGLMAQELRGEIALRGEAACPVCGSRVDAEAEPGFARIEADVPDEARVRLARETMNRAERERSEQDKRREALAARIQSREEAALQTAAGLLPGCESWEQLGDGRLDRRRTEASAETAAACVALREAQTRAKEYRELRQRLPEREQVLNQAREGRDGLRAKLQELRARMDALERLIRERAAQLSYPGQTEALAARKQMLAEHGALETALEKSKKALEEARTRRDTALGSLREKEELTQSRQRQREEADRGLEKALEETGFADREEARGALPPARERDPARWLQERRRVRSDWENACAHTGRELSRQRESLKGLRPVELTALRQELDEAGQGLSRAEEAWGRQENLLANHRQVLESASLALRELAGSERAWQRLDRLGSLAQGINSEEGRLSFDRYVMGAVFREILEMANRRLDIMSGGRYQLVHRSGADRRNAKAGLEIQVLDLSTGQLRGSESLSGGEGFFSSLALALGLADTVQNRTGGRSLEALFIDEGFGSLSGGVLEKALEVLSQLSEGRRLVGIISHVDQLEESIPQKIRVRSGEHGSSLSLEPA